MTIWQTTVLGAVAGFTIYLGLPVARLRNSGRNLQSLLTALALGVLLFLVVDILSKVLDPIGEAMKVGMKSGQWGPFALFLALLVVGLVVGLVGLVQFDTGVMRRQGAPRSPYQMAMMIAVALGLHNFSEGLAIGQAAVTGAIGFAFILIIGFGLHNITEGFAVAAPLAVGAARPSWAFLGTAGLVGGGPTFVGTLVGYSAHSVAAFVLFLALAAGALFYIIGETFVATRRLERPLWTAWGIAIGFLVAYGTDLLVSMGGA